MPKKVVIAVDSFKGSIAAHAAATTVASGWVRSRPDDAVVLRPMADGGEGTLDAFLFAVPGARRMPITVTGPEDRPVAASWVLLPPTERAPRGVGVVELATTSGIELLGTPPRLRPWDAHTRGFGEAIAAALGHGVSELVLGIGSSSSTDGGTAMLAALGARVVDASGNPIADGAQGLADLSEVDLSGLPALPEAGISVLTDVSNPLLGPHGAAAVFGPQKGATPQQIEEMAAGLTRLAGRVDVDPRTPGAGAAGGTGFGLLAWGARLVSGSRKVADLIGLSRAISDADFVITGEGSFDAQSAAGKVPAFVADLAAAAGVPVALIAGRIASDADTSAFTAVASLTAMAGSSEAAIGRPAHWLREAGAALALRR